MARNADESVKRCQVPGSSDKGPTLVSSVRKSIHENSEILLHRSIKQIIKSKSDQNKDSQCHGLITKEITRGHGQFMTDITWDLDCSTLRRTATGQNTVNQGHEQGHRISYMNNQGHRWLSTEQQGHGKYIAEMTRERKVHYRWSGSWKFNTGIIMDTYSSIQR